MCDGVRNGAAFSGVPLAVINTPYVQRLGTKAGPIARWMLKGRRTKKVMRTIYALRTPFHDLLRRELKSPHDQLNWNMDKRGAHENPDAAEIDNRQRIAVIQQELNRPAM